MSKLTEFRVLRECLLRAGVSPRHVRRYLCELTNHLADLTREEECAGQSHSVAEAAALTRLGSIDDLARAMTDKPQLISWSARAPWAAFGLVPVLALSAAYFLTCFYLWCGWQIYLPGNDTPFGVLHAASLFSAANLYFQAGKIFYYVAPILVAWAIEFVAARQRTTAIWPIFAVLLTSWMGGTARIQASRSALPNALGHIRMGFFTTDGSAVFNSLLVVAAIFAFSLLPYLFWRITRKLTTVV